MHAQIRSGTLHTKAVREALYGEVTNEPCSRCGLEPDTLTHCLVRCQNAVVERRKLVIQVVQRLKRLPLHPTAIIPIWFDKFIYSDKAIKASGRKTTKEYLSGMMGMENRAVGDIKRALCMNGIEEKVAERKARGFVHWVKLRCLKVLQLLYEHARKSEQEQHSSSVVNIVHTVDEALRASPNQNHL